MTAKQTKDPPIYDIPYLHKGHYDHMVHDQDIEDSIINYRNAAKDYIANHIVK